MEIRNKDGNVIGKIQFQSLQDQHVMDKIIMDLKPGEGKAIYMVDANGSHFTQQTNYAARAWDGEINELMDVLEPWRPLFPACTAENIELYYGFDNFTPEEINDMAEESKRTGRNVIVSDLKPNNTVVGVRMMYRSAKGSYVFQIFGTTKSRVHISDDGQLKMSKVDVRENEAFYISNAENTRLIWIEEDVHGKPLQYEIIGEGSAEELLNIANSMK